MVFERSPGMACLCILTLLLLIAPCKGLADIADPPALANDSDTWYEDPGPVTAGDNTTQAEYNTTLSPAENGTFLADLGEDLIPDTPPAPVEYVISGTIYAVTPTDRRPWTEGHIKVYVGEAEAAMEGSAYAAVLTGLDGGENVDVTVVHDSGYVLGSARGQVSLSTVIDVDAPALDISGDVYWDDHPADGATLFIYVNDRPYGPVKASASQGPMFSVSIAGGHPGDHVSVTASKGDRSGIVSQDAPDYNMFLTVNLKNSRTYIPYTDASMPIQSLVEQVKGPASVPSFITKTRRSKYNATHWDEKP
jgi:hypothetical protein